MAIEKRLVPYEFLVRYNPGGTVRGQHIRQLQQIYDTETGEVYAEREGPALPVKDGAFSIDEALGAVAAASVKAEEIEREARMQAIAERNEERQARLEAERTVLAERAEKAELATKLERANAEKDQLLLAAQRKNDRGDSAKG